jgi:transposase
MKHHSVDYKISAINHYYKVGSFRKTCKIFNCAKSSLQRWLKQYQQKNDVERKEREKKYEIKDEVKDYVKSYIKEHPNVTINIVRKLIKKKYKKEYSYYFIYGLFKEMRISYKILRQKYFPEKGDEEMEMKGFYKELLKYKITKVISIDETAVYVNSTKNRGYSKKGTRAIIKTNLYPYKKYNLLVAIKYGEIVGYKLYKDPLDKDKFVEFINDNIKDKYNEHLIILDNARFHRSKEVKEAIIKTDNDFLYTIRYKPECNPIENYFSQLKHYIKEKSPITFEEIETTIKNINSKIISENNLKNFFRYVFKQANEYLK